MLCLVNCLTLLCLSGSATDTSCGQYRSQRPTTHGIDLKDLHICIELKTLHRSDRLVLQREPPRLQLIPCDRLTVELLEPLDVRDLSLAPTVRQDLLLTRAEPFSQGSWLSSIHSARYSRARLLDCTISTKRNQGPLSLNTP